MEKSRKKKRGKRKRKRKRERSTVSYCPCPLADPNLLFTLLLAALSNFPSKPKIALPLIKKCLRNIHLSLLSKPQNPHQTLPTPILSLLPILLHSKHGAVARGGAKIVGAAALLSLEMNQQIAWDGETLKGLVSALVGSRRRVALAACNAILDLCTTSVGRERLVECSALESLIFKFFQVPLSLTFNSVRTVGNGDLTCQRVGFEKDGLSVLILDAAIILVNTCNIKQLKNIPSKLSECFLIFMKELWSKVHNQMFVSDSWDSIGGYAYLSNFRINNLTESIFRLSFNSSQLPMHFPLQVVKRRIFGNSDTSFKEFMLNHWEVSPFLWRGPSSAPIEENFFGSFVQSLKCDGLIPFPSSLLRNLVSCLPMASDELNILSFLNDMGYKLGCHLIYEQDIRVLKTEKHSKKEVHFFPQIRDCKSFEARQLFKSDIWRCDEAFKEGYTIALRGVEFRFENVAAVADGLASLLGQPSIGANIYLTPLNAQGLARHIDDHCVFVYQLLGTKKWTVYSQPDVHLPSLYSAPGTYNDVESGSSMAGCTHFTLEEGDILYIPRGFPHDACTDTDGCTVSAGSSLHLTLGIEVEPPFEWEGFAHIALRCWSQIQEKHRDPSAEFISGVLDVMSVNLLHIVIGLLGDSDPTFRKACLVGALSFPLEENDWLDVSQKDVFRRLIDKISEGSRFLEALKCVEVAIARQEDPFQRMRWLQYLTVEEKPFESHHLSMPFMEVADIFSLYAKYNHKAEDAFLQINSKFCSEVLFEDVVENYKTLLEKYKKVRKQYMKGMLSLHCN